MRQTNERYYVRNEVEPRQLTIAGLVEQCRMHGIPLEDTVISDVTDIVAVTRQPDGSHVIRLGNLD